MNVERSAPQGAVFLSYAREDADAARRIAEALRGFGIEVWFDQNELRGGDAWDAKIKKQIRECALFLPLVSAQTEERSEGYFRREWLLAVERTRDMAADRTFVVPVAIDATPEAKASVPDEFMRFQWVRLVDGEPTPEFVAQVKRLLDSPRKPALKPALPRPPTLPPELKQAARKETRDSDAPAARKKSGVPVAAWILLGAIAIGAAVFFVMRKPEAPVAAGGPAPSPSLSPTPSTPKAPRLADKSIAVLPFTNMSEDKDNAFFADGVHEDVLTNLALIRELRVVSRTTVQNYRSTTKSMKQIAEELGVTYILEGSVRRVGNKVRVTGQLIHAATDEHVWAQTYDRDLTDIFAIQSELSQQIAGALKAALSPEEKVFIERAPTANPAAYDLFLRGRNTRNTARSGLPAPLKQAEEEFQSAVNQDPNFAAAWGELAVVHALHAFWEIDHSPERMARGDAAIARAVQLAPDAPDIIGLVGTYAYYAHRDYAAATAQYEKLARLKPNDPTVYSSLALIQRRQGRWVESLANSRKAVELDPGNSGYLRNLIQSLEMSRRWPELLAAQRRYVLLATDKLAEEAIYTRDCYWATGSRKEYDAWLASLSPEQANSPRGIARRKRMAGSVGDYAEFIRLDRQQPYFDEDGVPHYLQALGAAVVYAAQGDLATARQRLADFPDELRARLVREPTNARLHGELGLMEALLGHNDEAVRLAQKGYDLLPESRDALDGMNFSLRMLMSVHAWIGDKDAAFADLAHILRTPATGLSVHALRDEPWLVHLHDDPRWEKLLADPKNNAPLF